MNPGVPPSDFYFIQRLYAYNPMKTGRSRLTEERMVFFDQAVSCAQMQKGAVYGKKRTACDSEPKGYCIQNALSG